MLWNLNRAQFVAELDLFLDWIGSRIQTLHQYQRNNYIYFSVTADEDRIECVVTYDEVWMVPRCYFRRFDSSGCFIANCPVPSAMIEMPPELGTTWWCLHPCSTTETLQNHLGADYGVIGALEYLKTWFDLYGVHNIYTDINRTHDATS